MHTEEQRMFLLPALRLFSIWGPNEKIESLEIENQNLKAEIAGIKANVGPE